MTSFGAEVADVALWANPGPALMEWVGGGKLRPPMAEGGLREIVGWDLVLLGDE